MSSESQPSASAAAEERLRAATVDVAAFLEPRIQAIVGELGELLRGQLPSSYSPQQLLVITEHVRAVLEVAVRHLRAGGPLEEMDAEAIAAPARRWADEGWPLDPRGFQLGARHLMSVVAEHAGELDLDDHTLFAMQDRFWAWATICASILADARSEHDLALARRDAARRADFLRDLATGNLTPERLERESEAYGLDLAAPYLAVCASCEDPVTGAALEAHVRRSAATSDHRTLQVVVDARLLAVTPTAPAPFEGAAIAIGPATTLEGAHASFDEATKALLAARAFNITGLVDLAALGPLPLAIEADALAARLSARHFPELDGRGRAGLEIEDAVRTLLELDRSVEATAERLHVHRNTVRYRVSRFTELTGLDLGRTEDLVTTWWLLTRRHLSRSGASEK